MLKYSAVIFLIFPFLYGCKKNDAIEKIATFQFRNLHKGEQLLTNPQMERLRNANPSLYAILPKHQPILPEQQKMFNKLNVLQVVNNNCLQLQNLQFKFSQDDSPHTDMAYDYCRVFFDESTGHRVLEVKTNVKTIQIPILNDLPSLQYGYVDIVEGGEKEILVLSSYDLSDGRNYDLDIYEVN